MIPVSFLKASTRSSTDDGTLHACLLSNRSIKIVFMLVHVFGVDRVDWTVEGAPPCALPPVEKRLLYYMLYSTRQRHLRSWELRISASSLDEDNNVTF